MEWIIIEDFPLGNVEEHIKLFENLRSMDTVFLVRKEFLKFEELEKDEKNEIIEENYDLFKDGLLHFKTKDVERKVEAQIFSIIKQFSKIKTQEMDNSISGMLEILEKNEDIETIEQIKRVITYTIVKDREKRGGLLPNNFVYRTKENQSHKYNVSNGELENECKDFEWYKISNINDLKQFIEENSNNYNIMLTQDNRGYNQYSYYLNYYEGNKFTLAVQDNEGDFCKKFNNIFLQKYHIQSDRII